MRNKQENRVVMLRTESSSALYLTPNEKLCIGDDIVLSKESTCVNQHLYILADQEIKNGDYYIYKSTFMDGTVKTREQFDTAAWIICKATKGDFPYIERARNGRNAENNLLGLYKIISTTDKSLGLPIINNLLVLEYIKLHNRYTPFNEALVSYIIDSFGDTLIPDNISD